MKETLDSLFLQFRDVHDLRALAKVFDRAAPELATVATYLARSADEAEDLIQATFLTAIESAEAYDASRPLLPWLLGILAMHARKLRQRQGRVPDPERLHQAESSDPLREAERSEIVRAVGLAVQRLSPSYAPLVRRHLVDGATPAVLAKEFDLSPITTRVRLSRGLKQLRELLPAGLSVAAFGSISRHVDLAEVRKSVLARASSLTGVAVPGGSFISIGLLLAFLAPLGLAVPAWMFWRAPAAAELSPDASNLAVEPATAMEPAESPLHLRVLPEALPDPREASVATAAASNASVRGRLLLPDGQPAIGFELSLEGNCTQEDRSWIEGDPTPWIAPAPVLSDVEGRFQFSFETRVGLHMEIAAAAEAFAPLSWDLWDIQAAASVDLGDATLETARSLSVRILDGQGHVLGAGWKLQAEFEPPASGVSRATQRRQGEYLAATQHFLLTRLPPRRVIVNADHDSGAEIPERVIDLSPGGADTLDLVYTGPDPSRSIALTLRLPRGAMISSGVQNIRLTRAGMDPIAAAPIPKWNHAYRFDDLEPGDYALRIDDPRFVPLTLDNLHPGDCVKPELKGRSAVRVTILNADLSAYSGRCVLSLLGFSTGAGDARHTRVPLLKEEWSTSELIPGLLPGNYEFELLLADHKPRMIAVESLAADETREVVVTLDAQGGLSGRVLSPEGVLPMSDVAVHVTRGARAGHTGGAGAMVHTREGQVPRVDASTTTDAQGRFHFDALEPGTWTIQVAWSPAFDVVRTLQLPAEHEIEVWQPACGTLKGVLLLPEGASAKSLKLDARPSSNPGHGVPRLRDGIIVSEDGRFEIGPLPTGSVKLGISRTAELGQHSRTSRGFSVTSWEIVANATTLAEVDLRTTFPATIRAAIRIDDAPAHGGAFFAGHGDVGSMAASTSKVSAEGVGLAGSFDPGVAVQMAFISEQGWAWVAPQTPSLPPYAEAQFELSFTTAEREIRVLDSATLQPLPGVQVHWICGANPHQDIADAVARCEQIQKTDAQGRLLARLPVGAGAFRAGKIGTFSPESATWSSGTTPIVLHLTRTP